MKFETINFYSYLFTLHVKILLSRNEIHVRFPLNNAKSIYDGLHAKPPMNYSEHFPKKNTYTNFIYNFRIIVYIQSLFVEQIPIKKRYFHLFLHIRYINRSSINLIFNRIIFSTSSKIAIWYSE